MKLAVREFRYAEHLTRYVNENGITKDDIEVIKRDDERAVWMIIFWHADDETPPPPTGFFRADEGPRNS